MALSSEGLGYLTAINDARQLLIAAVESQLARERNERCSVN